MCAHFKSYLTEQISNVFFPSCSQVLCPRCDVGTGHTRLKSKKGKEASQINKKSATKVESLCDVDRALSESKDSASAVSGNAVFDILSATVSVGL